jgi:hypothetical protein
MAITKIQAGALPADVITTAAIDDASITHAKLHTTMDLSSKTVTLPTLSSLNTTGNVGIGTASPGARLHAYTTGYPVSKFERYGSSAATRGSTQIGHSALGYGGTGADTYIVSEHGFGVAVNAGTNAFVITDGGKVGIGTSSPSADLHISSTVQPTIRVTDSDNNNTAFMQADGVNGAYFGTLTNHPVRLAPNNSTKMIVTTDGNVGIGTNSPTRQLDVSKAGTAYIRASDTANSVNMDMLAASSGGWLGTQTNHSLNLQTNNTERIRITTSGNLMLDPNSVGNKYARFGTSSTGDGHILLDRGGAHKWQITSGLTNALQFHNYTAGSESMRIDASGRVTIPNQPSFAASRNSGHLSSGTFIYNDVKHNIGSHYNSSNGRFTAPVTGRYFIGSMLMTMNDVTYNNTSYIIAKNGTMFQRAYNSSGGSFHHQFQWSGIVSLNANDYVTIIYSNATMYGDSSAYSWFSGHLLG